MPHSSFCYQKVGPLNCSKISLNKKGKICFNNVDKSRAVVSESPTLIICLRKWWHILFELNSFTVSNMKPRIIECML